MLTLSRAQTGLKPPRAEPLRLPWAAIDTIYVHYTGMHADRDGDPAARWRGVQAYHRDTLGWNDIGYNFGFARAGQVLEGRGWQVWPAATLGHNHHSVAFVFLGADRDGRDDVTDAGRRALGELIFEAERLSEKKLLVAGGLSVAPHSAVVNTACPGDELRSFIDLRGWETERKAEWPTPLPKWTWRWMAWRLGEGEYKEHGPANPAVRHLTGAPKFIKPWAWARLRALLKARQK